MGRNLYNIEREKNIPHTGDTNSLVLMRIIGPIQFWRGCVIKKILHKRDTKSVNWCGLMWTLWPRLSWWKYKIIGSTKVFCHQKNLKSCGKMVHVRTHLCASVVYPSLDILSPLPNNLCWILCYKILSTLLGWLCESFIENYFYRTLYIPTSVYW